MKPIRVPWHLLLGIALGFGLGLVISWMVAPQASTENTPAQLQNESKENYRALIAAAYASTSDLGRAKMRLNTLEDENIANALQSQAQRALANGDTPNSLKALAHLAADLQEKSPTAEKTIATKTPFRTKTPSAPTQTGTPPTLTLTSTAEGSAPTLTPIPFYTRTPRATTTSSPTASVPFILKTQDEICSTNLSENLLMIYVSDSFEKEIAGVEIIIEWDGGEEHFFTGLKPELGKGYADFIMQTGKNYAVHLATGSVAVSNLSAPACEDGEGNHYWGSLQLKFGQ